MWLELLNMNKWISKPREVRREVIKIQCHHVNVNGECAFWMCIVNVPSLMSSVMMMVMMLLLNKRGESICHISRTLWDCQHWPISTNIRGHHSYFAYLEKHLWTPTSMDTNIRGHQHQPIWRNIPKHHFTAAPKSFLLKERNSSFCWGALKESLGVEQYPQRIQIPFQQVWIHLADTNNLRA